MNDRRHIARVEVTPELLAEALHFPAGTKILHVECGYNSFGADSVHLTLVVEHPDLEAVDEGVMAPIVTPKVTRYADEWDFEW